MTVVNKEAGEIEVGCLREMAIEYADRARYYRRLPPPCFQEEAEFQEARAKFLTEQADKIDAEVRRCAT